MTSAIFSDGRPWTESDFLALDESAERIELLDGSLHVTPAPTPRHQYISGELRAALRPATRTAGVNVLEAVNVRLRPNRIPIPDLVVTSDINFDELVIDADAILLACEIISPSNAAIDRVLKMHYYAAAGIPRYLLIDQASGTMYLYELVGETYIERSVTKADEVLHLTEPVVATISPGELLPPR